MIFSIRDWVNIDRTPRGLHITKYLSQVIKNIVSIDAIPVKFSINPIKIHAKFPRSHLSNEEWFLDKLL